jgi:hypothetical protein
VRTKLDAPSRLFGFTDRKRTNAGYVLWLDLRTRKRIHTLAHEHGIDQDPWFTGEGFGAGCGLCKELADSNRSSAELNGMLEPSVARISRVMEITIQESRRSLTMWTTTAS